MAVLSDKCDIPAMGGAVRGLAFSTLAMLLAFMPSCGGSDDSGSGGTSTGGKSTGGSSSGGTSSGGTASGGTSSGGTSSGGTSSGGTVGDAGINLDDLGQPCVNDQCPAGLTPVKYCGLAGCNGTQLCSCEIPCETSPNVCPAGTTCTTIADGPGAVCVKT